MGKIKKGTVRSVNFPVIAFSPNDLSTAGERFPFRNSDIISYKIPEGSGISNVSFDAWKGYFSLEFRADQIGEVDEVVQVFTRNEGTIYLTLSGEVTE